MIGLPAGTRVWLAVGRTDAGKGFDGLVAADQERLAQDPSCGQLFVFRGRRGDLLKMLWWDGQGLCLLAKRLERAVSCGPAGRKACISVRSAARGRARLELAGLLNWQRRIRPIEENGDFPLKQDTNAYVVLPTSQRRGFFEWGEAPAPYPSTWGAVPPPAAGHRAGSR
jgi:transposase